MSTGNAEQLGELISAYVDGELDERDSQRAAGILRQDPRARQLYADLKRTRELVHGLPRHAAPTSIAADVLARLERSALLPESDAKPRALPRTRSWWKAPLSLAAVLGLCAIGWWALPLASPEAADLLAKRDAPYEVEAKTDTLAAKPARDSATVEAKLAAGVALAALQEHPFANEPVRLQLVVDSERERDEVLRRLEKRFVAAKVPDLARDLPKKEPSAGGNRDAIFVYQGRPGVNFADADSQQFLVRAAPRQVQSVLKEVDRVARRDDQLSLQAGALNMQGPKVIQAVQLFSEAASPEVERDEALADTAAAAPADGDDDSNAPNEEATRFVQELLAAAGIDPRTVGSDALDKSRKEEAPARVGEAAPEARSRESAVSGARSEAAAVGRSASSKPATEKKMETDMSAPTQPPGPPENHLTFILEVRTKPKPAAPANPGTLRAPKPRNLTGSGSTRSHNFSS